MRDLISDILSKHVEVYGYVSTDEYLKKRRLLELNDGFDDKALFAPYKTIITLGISYPSKEVKWLGPGYGLLSRYSYSIDYHIVFKAIIDKIINEFDKLNIKSHGSVDTSFVDERYAANLSGMGYLGKNQFLINKKYGSYLYLATILVDIPIDKNIIEYDSCNDCRICIDACPSNSLDNGFDATRCISSLTQMKKALNKKEIGYIQTMIYGCDICQKVCPKNKDVDYHLHDEFEPNGIENINIEELLNMTNKKYKAVYGNNASSWKGATIIKRNALCLIANQNLVEHNNIVEKISENSQISWYKATAKNVIKILENK